MKFETPIAEVELFELKDIISASDESGTTEWTFDPQMTGYMNEPTCLYGDARDNNNFDECFL